MKKLNVELGNRSYQIKMDHHLLDAAGEFIRDHAKNVIIVADQAVGILHGARLEGALRKSGVAVLDKIILPVGEETKSFSGLEKLCTKILESGIDRKTVLIALGGGVIGDLVGFASAILLRGIPFVQIPTTLLAQVDSSVGGKTGINAPTGKNLIGAFNQPQAVLIDFSLLDTLPARQMRAGYAEIVKYGLINDPLFFEWCEENGSKVLAHDKTALEHAVHYSCKSKAAIVAADEREENGRRALLNLGHTFGHAFETEAGYSDTLLHGEAVALGIVQAFRLSVQLGLCAEKDSVRVKKHFDAVGLPTDWRTYKFDPEKLIAHMHKDKKAEGGTLNFVLADSIGGAKLVRNIDVAEVRKILGN